MNIHFQGRADHETLLDWMRRMEGLPPPTEQELRQRRRAAAIAYVLRALLVIAIAAFLVLAIALAFLRPSTFFAGFIPAFLMSMLAAARVR